MDQKSAPLVEALAAIEKHPVVEVACDMNSGCTHESARAEWHRQRADRGRQLADTTQDPSARGVHLALAKLHERASKEGYALQVAGDR